MKKLLKASLSLLAISTLFTSCSASEDVNFRISYTSKQFQGFASGKGKDDTVYIIYLNASNNTDGSVTLKNTDFALVTGGKTYTALYFCEGWATGFSSDSGSYAYITGTKNEIVIEKNKAIDSYSVDTTSFYTCFEVKGEDDYKITYKGNDIYDYSNL